MSNFPAFSAVATSVGIGKLTVENAEDQVSIYGSLDVTRDKQGLAHARELKAILDQVVATFESTSLPDTSPATANTITVKNPFA